MAEFSAVPGARKPFCCWVHSETGETCANDAAYGMYPVPRSDPYDYTEACAEHVGELLSDAPEHRVLRLEPASGEERE